MQFAHKFTQLNYGKNAELSHECLRAPESERERKREIGKSMPNFALSICVCVCIDAM